jgi:hypothetical protein|tara:strand:+ start:1824 stop:2027 length:204 start_codon:yes stop_codon:yes gene_type:complete
VRSRGVSTVSNQSSSSEISSDDDNDFNGFVDALLELPLNKEKDTEELALCPIAEFLYSSDWEMVCTL